MLADEIPFDDPTRATVHTYSTSLPSLDPIFYDPWESVMLDTDAHFCTAQDMISRNCASRVAPHIHPGAAPISNVVVPDHRLGTMFDAFWIAFSSC